VEEDVGDLFQVLRVPDVTQQKRVPETDEGDVGGGRGFEVRAGAFGEEGYPLRWSFFDR
jgi:hypothetical protein